MLVCLVGHYHDKWYIQNTVIETTELLGYSVDLEHGGPELGKQSGSDQNFPLKEIEATLVSGARAQWTQAACLLVLLPAPLSQPQATEGSQDEEKCCSARGVEYNGEKREQGGQEHNNKLDMTEPITADQTRNQKTEAKQDWRHQWKWKE